jgi:hypothetical protein
MRCKNKTCWANSEYHAQGCILGLIDGCETNGVKCQDEFGYNLMTKHSLTNGEADATHGLPKR